MYDSELGFSKRSVATGAVNFAQIAGSYGPFLGLNEDGTGKYGVCRRHQGPLHHVFRRPGLLVARADRG